MVIISSTIGLVILRKVHRGSVAKINCLKIFWSLSFIFLFFNSKVFFMISFSGRHYPKFIILQCVRWYVSYALSYRRIAGIELMNMIQKNQLKFTKYIDQNLTLAQQFYRFATLPTYNTLKVNIANILSFDYVGALIVTIFFPFFLLLFFGIY